MIMTYDVGEKRVMKVLKIARKYLTHVQYSVLEGEISAGRFKRLKRELAKVIDETHDTICFYKLLRAENLRKERMGIATDEPTQIL